MNLSMHETDEEGNPNRFVRIINQKTFEIQDNIDCGRITAERVKEIHHDLDMPMEEFCQFQEFKSLAVQAELITLSEGMAIYHYLGSIPETFNQQPIAVKAVLSSFFLELLTLRKAGKL